MRRFANVVRRKESEFAELIARETGKPLWETRTEVAAVVNKVVNDLAAKGVSLSEADIRARMDEFMAQAVAQVKAGT